VLRAALVLTALALGACAPRPEERFHTERIVAMGTLVDVVAEVPDPERRADLVRDIETLLRGFERDYYAWADGELSRLNEGLGRGEQVRVTPALADLLRVAQRYSEQSNGAFEPGVGALVELWGFHSGTAAPSGPPDPAAIAAWVERDSGIRNLEIAPDGTVTHARGAAFMLDLGGIAKGTALDRVIAELRNAGIEHALVNTGGQVRVLGSRDERPWRVGIRTPRAEAVLGVVELQSGESVSTSGDYERYYEHAGKRMHHILDPRTGYPVTHTQAVTVIAADGTLADAASTALFVAGRKEWRAIAQALGVALALRVDASGDIEMTAAMRDRFQSDGDPDSPIIVPK
jgi:thiamine biosynthesis lipoprotein